MMLSLNKVCSKKNPYLLAVMWIYLNSSFLGKLSRYIHFNSVNQFYAKISSA